MENIKLELAALKHQTMYEAYRKETYEANEPYINGDGGAHRYANYSEWMKNEEDGRLGIHLKDNYVPATTYFLVRGDKLLGTVNIRHELNDELRFSGGHIGYSVAPSERRKGYATYMLVEALKICKEMNIDPVLVTCKKENIGSRKTIEKCGGQLGNEWYDENEKETYLRFWIGEKNND